MINKENTSWCQKMKLKWIKEDCNFAFFHPMASGRRNKIWIGPLIKANEERTHIDKEVSSGFLDLLSHVVIPRPFVQGIEWCPISSREGEELEVPLTVEEVRNMVFGSDTNNFPRPEGFSMAFSNITGIF